jgi:hypothetical protein
VGDHANAATAAHDQNTLVGLFELSVQAHADALAALMGPPVPASASGN